MRSIRTRTDVLKAINQAEEKFTRREAEPLPLSSGMLFAGGSEVVVTHGTETYRLRLMRQNKLILTK